MGAPVPCGGGGGPAGVRAAAPLPRSLAWPGGDAALVAGPGGGRGGPAEPALDPGLAPAGPGPVWVEDFAWTDPRLAALPTEGEELTRVERMLARGRGELRRLAQEPAVVGWTWPRATELASPAPWTDPSLVDGRGEELAVHAEALAWVNHRAPGWRRSPAAPALRACAAAAAPASSPPADAPPRP